MNLLVSPALPEERAEALHLFFQHASEADRAKYVQKAHRLVAKGEIPPEGLLVCRSQDAIIGAIAALPLTGGAGLIWPPQVIIPSAASMEDALVVSATHWLRQRGVRFVQALLADMDVPFADPLLRQGFRRITTLVYLHRDLSSLDDPQANSERLRFQRYLDCDKANFNFVLLGSYEGTHDCPELNNLRDAEEIVAGYQAVPGCRLDRWWLAWRAQTAVGVLILVPSREPKAWELAYLGLILNQRGQGFGMEMTRKALAEARDAGASRLTLTVDLRNEPAQKMYKRLGFEEFDRREVMLTIFGNA